MIYLQGDPNQNFGFQMAVFFHFSKICLHFSAVCVCIIFQKRKKKKKTTASQRLISELWLIEIVNFDLGHPVFENFIPSSEIISTILFMISSAERFLKLSPVFF